MADGSSVVNLGDLGKPATALVEKTYDALGGVFKPFQISRVAKAEAKADIIRAQSRLDVSELERRALTRFVGEEAKKQENMEAIIEQAIPQLDDAATPQNMENDWVANFFDKCRIVSDQEMQTLWSRILAGEANANGSYAKRTVHLLSELDKTDTRLFATLCGYAWVVGDDVVPLVFDYKHLIYNDAGIDFNGLQHLDSIGLIHFDSIGTYSLDDHSRYVMTSYHGEPIMVDNGKVERTSFVIGRALFTRSGEQLLHVCESEPVDGFLDFTVDRWSDHGLILSSPFPRANVVPVP